MSSAIEATVKALVEFEAELDRAKSDLSDAKKRAMKDALGWAEAARASAVSKAQEIASGKVSRAKAEAEAQAREIRKKGEKSLEEFEASLSKYRAQAAHLAASRLLGGSG